VRAVAAVAAACCVFCAVAVAALPSHETLFSPSWSPGGANLAWGRGGGLGSRVWVAAPDGSSPQQLAHVFDGIGRLTWMPSGIIVDSNFRLYLLGLDGKTTQLGPALDLTFSTDAGGTKVATGSPGCPSCHGRLQILDVRTHKIRYVGLEKDANESPTLSPDAKRVAFVRNACKPNDECSVVRGLWVAPTAGGAARRLAASGVCPSWSPDGRAVAYVTRAGELRTISGTGGRSTLIAKGAACPTTPQWSSDSHSLAFVSTDHGLRIADARSHRVVARSPRSIGWVLDAAWSPDGSTVAVTGRPAGGGTCASVWLVGTQDGQARLAGSCM